MENRLPLEAPLKALVVDDSRAMRMILANILAGLGFVSEQAANGKEALTAARRDRDFALFLVDWNMPQMNGLEFVRHIRADPGFHQTPILMVTTETEMPQMIEALEAGANEYVMKPFTPGAIVQKLRMIGVVS